MSTELNAFCIIMQKYTKYESLLNHLTYALQKNKIISIESPRGGCLLLSQQTNKFNRREYA